ncbi:Hypothetical predicted protein [Lecanosticta acicola]|uniref:UBC core domain-containing protein n=1 Tax=Lecanosticta acicola TaxID=111012 RepID=A0AAI8Z5Q1_9PEZI|nr:Hypothetical predicted protein [Lecanosticta acicola]
MATQAQAIGNHLRQRLLHDIHEIQTKPYPGIDFRLQDDSKLAKACLILSFDDGQPPIHLTVDFEHDYPLRPPNITCQSQVDHPNVMQGYICVDILTHDKAYTPAYTLKGICIQMLSLFKSDHVDQEDGIRGEKGEKVNLKKWRATEEELDGPLKDTYKCDRCMFPTHRFLDGKPDATTNGTMGNPQKSQKTAVPALSNQDSQFAQINDLPDEMLVTICELLDEEPLILATQAWKRFERIVPAILRNRELQCFTLKRGSNALNLGIGVHVDVKNVESEFDLISSVAYDTYGVRKSVHGPSFELWLPLPITHRHWDRVKSEVQASLNAIARQRRIQGTLDNVLYEFMNGVVVKLSHGTSHLSKQQELNFRGNAKTQSSVTHASEKAIESYFHLFHLLVCLATERSRGASEGSSKNDIVKAADKLIYDFLANEKRDKTDTPNLGYLLIAILISDVDVSSDLQQAIIEETLIRNVVWMLDPKPPGKQMPELAYLEPSAVSHYRIRKSFEASKTGLRLLMFLNTMRKIVRGMRDVYGQAGKRTGEKLTLEQLRDKLFDRHGAGPTGAATLFAERVRKIQQVDCYADFFKEMGLPAPADEELTTLLRESVRRSMQKGYTQEALTQGRALFLRLEKEPDVERAPGVEAEQMLGNFSFFPRARGGGHQGSQGAGRGGRGGRGHRGGRSSWRGGRHR